MTAQCLQKWLKAAVDDAAQDWTVDLHPADSRRALDLLGGRGADETDLDVLYR